MMALDAIWMLHALAQAEHPYAYLVAIERRATPRPRG
jgi:hypothetical protein